MSTFKYKAFISYSHKDRKWAQWLHKRLEAYPIPKHLVHTNTLTGIIPKRLKPIFRDREELSASHELGTKIEQALKESQALIIICSPAAAQSHWVNQEILMFKRQNRGAQLFSFIVEGEPFATNIKNCEDDECFPPALRFKLGDNGELSSIQTEPLAADVREHSDGKRLGVLKLISGLIGVGLDEIIQRDMRRTRTRVTAITSSALTLVLIMGTLTTYALTSQKEAEIQKGVAQKRTASAEELIEFMVTDLKTELEAVGRLDALQAVGEKASSYYDQYPIDLHNDDALGRRARVFHYLGEIQNTEGKFVEAKKHFEEAYAATYRLLNRDPSNAEIVFNHAQSSFFLGYLLWKEKEYKLAKPYFSEYVTYARALNDLEPGILRSTQELTYAESNMGIFLLDQGQKKEAHEIFLKLVPIYKRIVELTSNTFEKDSSLQSKLDLAQVYAWLSDSSELPEDSINFRQKQLNIYDTLERLNPNNLKLKNEIVTTKYALARKSYYQGNIIWAKETVAEALIVSSNMWKQDNKNMEWFKIFIRLSLLDAEIAICSGDSNILNDRISQVESLKAIAFSELSSDYRFIDEFNSDYQFMQKHKGSKIKYCRNEN